MNKYILILSCLFTIATFAQSKIDFVKKLKIEHTYGDESLNVEEMEFIIRDGKVYGKILNPNVDALLNSETKLGENEINTLNTFLKLVDEYQNGCKEEFTSSYVQCYTITKDGKETKIYKFCDWGIVTYFDIKQKIFGNYIKNLEKKKLNLNNEYFALLKGKWTENIQIDLLDTISVLKAEKMNDKLTTKEYIEFNVKNEMMLHTKEKVIYYKYKIDILGNEKYLWISGDKNKNGDEFIYGHRFLIILLNKNKMKLIRA